MKKILLTACLISLNFFASAKDMNDMDMGKKDAKQQPQQATYTCPMHSEIQEIKPGNCPKCGMN